jgi:hypothetical protein
VLVVRHAVLKTTDESVLTVRVVSAQMGLHNEVGLTHLLGAERSIGEHPGTREGRVVYAKPLAIARRVTTSGA